MEKILIKKEEFNISKWSGGTTMETAVFPFGSKYLERDFIWRLSSATVNLEESSFTKLPDFDRILIVLEGEAVLAHGQERSVSLKQYQQDSFDGAVKTKCFGTITDYNLMFRKGSHGRLELFNAEEKSKILKVTPESTHTGSSYGIYCIDGYIVAVADGQQTMIKAGEQFIINCSPEDDKTIRIMGEGKGIFAEVLYDIDAFVSEKILEEKPSFTDYKTALKMIFCRNKWSSALQAGGAKGVWYDRALQKKLRIIDKSNLNVIIWIIGVIAAVALFFGKYTSSTLLLIIIAWLLLVVFIVAPITYILLLPTPIKAHIKKIEELNELEMKLYREDTIASQKVAGLMKKYRSSDDEGFMREGDSRFKRLFK